MWVSNYEFFYLWAVKVKKKFTMETKKIALKYDFKTKNEPYFLHFYVIKGEILNLCTFSHSFIEVFFTKLLLKNSQRAIINSSRKAKIKKWEGFSSMRTEKEFINYINECPTTVKIRGNRQNIILSCEDTEVKFPVVDQIYTRFVCSLSHAEILSKGRLDTITNEGLTALAEAATNKKASSFDLVFQA